MKIALVTGTSTGIGLETAVLAAKAGYKVVATMRNTAKASALLERLPDADVRQLDVTDPDSVRACVDGVIADHGRLDALINNAGAGHLGTIELESVDDVRDVMEVNFFGVVQVTKAALPHLRAAEGRLITVTSVGAWSASRSTRLIAQPSSRSRAGWRVSPRSSASSVSR